VESDDTGDGQRPQAVYVGTIWIMRVVHALQFLQKASTDLRGARTAPSVPRRWQIRRWRQRIYCASRRDLTKWTRRSGTSALLSHLQQCHPVGGTVDSPSGAWRRAASWARHEEMESRFRTMVAGRAEDFTTKRGRLAGGTGRLAIALSLRKSSRCRVSNSI
jgi:hypothetical protein